MPIDFLGDDYPLIPRIHTGFHSLDKSLSKDNIVGWPLRTMTEIYGPTGIGKTNFTLSIAGIIARNLGGNIGICPIDNLDKDIARDTLHGVNYEGQVHISLKKEDEESVDNLMDMMWDEDKYNLSVGILDSLASISPISEQEGSVGDANMGRRAKIASTMSHKVNHALKLRKTPSVFLFTNHVHQNIGFVGSTTSGGVTSKYMSQIRIRLKGVDDFNDGVVLEGKIEKFNFGPEGRLFHVFMIGGHGLHMGLSAVFDCIYAKKATAENVVKMNGKSYGRVNKMVENRDDEELFKPFITALNDNPEVDTNGQSPDELMEA